MQVSMVDAVWCGRASYAHASPSLYENVGRRRVKKHTEHKRKAVCDRGTVVSGRCVCEQIARSKSQRVDDALSPKRSTAVKAPYRSERIW